MLINILSADSISHQHKEKSDRFCLVISAKRNKQKKNMFSTNTIGTFLF